MNSERRAFLEQFVKPFKNKHNDYINGTTEERIAISAELITETALVAAAIYVGYEGGKNRIYNVRPVPVETIGQNSDRVGEIRSQIEQVQFGLPEVVSLVSRLGKIWQDTYSHMEPKEMKVPDGEGGTNTITYYEREWDEPRALKSLGLHHNQIGRWKKFTTAYSNRLNRLNQEFPLAAALEQNGYDSYRFETQEIDQGTRNVLATLGFGSAAVAFTFYEEIISNFKAGDYFYRGPRLDQIAINRRTFLKAVLGGSALFPLRNIQRSLVDKSIGHEATVRQSTHDLITQYREASPISVFRSYFESTPQELDRHLAGMEDIASLALEAASEKKPAKWDRVEPAMMEVRQAISAYRENFRQHFNLASDAQLPEHFAVGLKSIFTQHQVQRLTRENTINANTQAIINSLFFAGLLTGVAVSTEGIIKLTEKIQQHFR